MDGTYERGKVAESLGHDRFKIKGGFEALNYEGDRVINLNVLISDEFRFVTVTINVVTGETNVEE